MILPTHLYPLDVSVDLKKLQTMRLLATGSHRRYRRHRRRVEGIVAFPAVSGVLDQVDLLVVV